MDSEFSVKLAALYSDDVTKAPPWHGWVTADTIFSSLASGSFAVATILVLFSPTVFGAVARACFIVAFAALMTDVVCLILDLGDPLRFHHMLRTFNPKSPMSVGVWAMVIFSLFSFADFLGSLAWFFGVGDFTQPVRIAAAIGILPALAVASYKGVLMSSTAQPEWREMRWLGATLSTSAGTLGLAVALAASVALQSSPPAISMLRHSFAAVALISALTMADDLIDALSELRERLGDTPAILWTAAAIGGGSIVPALGVLFESGAGSFKDLWAAILAFAGALAFRHLLIIRPHRRAGGSDGRDATSRKDRARGQCDRSESWPESPR